MDSIIIAAILAAVVIIIAAVIALIKFRTNSEEPKKPDGKKAAPIEKEREKGKKDEKKNNDPDFPAFNRLQKMIDSNWIQNFEYKQLTYPQFVQVSVTDDLHSYLNESEKSENKFFNHKLSEAHLVFIKAIKAFISATLRETMFVRPESKASVIRTKAEGYKKWSKDYDKSYDREVKIITYRTKAIINAYKRFVRVARNKMVCL